MGSLWARVRSVVKPQDMVLDVTPVPEAEPRVSARHVRLLMSPVASIKVDVLGGNVNAASGDLVCLPFADCSVGPRSWDRPLYAFRGGFKGAGASSTDSKIAANIERGF